MTAPLAPLAVVGPGRTRVALERPHRASTVVDLARAAGLESVDPVPIDPVIADHVIADAVVIDSVVVDGVATRLTSTLIAAGVRHGSSISSAAAAAVGAAIDLDSQPQVSEAVWLSGADAGASIQLTPGAHLVGRAPTARVRCADRSLELHHALLDVGADGTLHISQLAGRRPIMVDGVEIVGRTAVAPRARVTIGATELSFAAPTERLPQATIRAGGVDDPWHMRVIRAPRAIPTFDPRPIAAPRSLAESTTVAPGLLPTMLGVAGAAVIAILLRQPMFFLFGLMGALVAVGTWVAARFGVIRSRRSSNRSQQAQRATFDDELQQQRGQARSHHAATVPTLAAALRTIECAGVGLWAVRATDPDAFVVSLGRGDLSWKPVVSGLCADTGPELLGSIDAAARLDSMPVPVTLAAGAVVAMAGGDRATGVARSMIVQLAAASGPADWRLIVISDTPGRWLGMDWLPHFGSGIARPCIVGSGEIADLVDELDPDDCRHVVIVADVPDVLSSRTAPLRRLVARGRSIAVLAVCATADDVPAVATSALVIHRFGSARWIADTRADALAEPVRIAGISVERAHDAFATLGRYIDPECSAGGTPVPQRVELLELLGAASDGEDGRGLAQQIAARWSAGGVDPAPTTPIGVAADGVIELDLVTDGPHGLLAGTTGAGKSELLRSLVLGLASRLSPNAISFVLVDFKGGSTFDACADLPHVVGLVTDLDDRLATRALRSLDAELRRRERILRDAGANDLTSYRALGAAAPLPRLVVVIDEFANLAAQQPDFIGALLGIAQRGRSLGVHLLLATQRPAGVVSDEIKANTNLRIALRVQDPAESVDLVGHAAAARLPRALPGRAVMRLGSDESVMFQTACTSRPELIVAAVRAATKMHAISRPHRPWLEPLHVGMAHGFGDYTSVDAGHDPPGVVGVPGVPGVIGVVDDPDHQRRLPLQWCRDDGHLLVLGSPRMGATTTLLTIVAAISREATPPEVFVIDAMGDARLNLLGSLPGCVGVVRLHEHERLMRLLSLLTSELTKRRSLVAGSARQIVVAVDGVGSLRDELTAMDMHDQLDQFDQIVADGASAGIVIAATTNRAGALPARLLGQIGQRWMLHLADPLDAPMLGVPVALVPPPIVGRIVDARTHREAQIVPVDEQLLLEHACSLNDLPSAMADRRVLIELPNAVHLADLPHAARRPHPHSHGSTGGIDISIGRQFSNLEPATMHIAAGEHLLVLGPARSGRSTALRTIARAWTMARGGGTVVSIARRRSSVREGAVVSGVDELPSLPGIGEVLVVIDDAELVDDPTHRLASVIEGRTEGITVVAAGRPDALRAAYGHWTHAVRRSRAGIVMAASSDLDGDLLGVMLPRRCPILPRPGLGWMVGDGGAQLIQVATSPETHGPAIHHRGVAHLTLQVQ